MINEWISANLGFGGNQITASNLFEVTLRTDKDHYKSGEQVNGAVTLNIKTPCVLKNFKLRAFGKENAIFYEEKRHDNNGETSYTYIKHEQSFDWMDKGVLTILGENLENEISQVGSTEHPFSF